MGEWALPPVESRAFAAALHAAQAEAHPEVRWLRGASWRNFQVRYREINDLHKQMLLTSDKVEAMPDGRARTRALDHLYRGQSNDCYWHGLFGGVYIAHMRLATWAELIAAEDLADAEDGRLHAAERRDFDLDGHDDVRLAGPGQVVTIDLDEGAGIGGWDIRPVRHASCAVMRRRPEAYHEILRSHDADAARLKAGGRGDTPTSIHEMAVPKEKGLAAHLYYDAYERRSGLVRFLHPATTPEAWETARAIELGDAVEGAFEVETLALDRLVASRRATVSGPAGDAAVVVTKDVTLGGDRRSPTLALTITVANQSKNRVEAILGIEWTLMMLGGGGNPAAWWEVDRTRTGHDRRGSAAGVTAFAQGNDYVGVAVDTTISEPADVWWAPVETVSNSEAGVERVYQGSGQLVSWPLSLAAGASRTVRMVQAVTTARDLAVDDAAETVASAPRTAS
jgi:alpha-amylase